MARFAPFHSLVLLTNSVNTTISVLVSITNVISNSLYVFYKNNVNFFKNEKVVFENKKSSNRKVTQIITTEEVTAPLLRIIK